LQSANKQQGAELPPSGSFLHIAPTTQEITESLIKVPFKQAPIETGELTHLFFRQPAPPKFPYNTNNSPAAQTTWAKVPLKNRFEPIAEQGSRLDDKDNERLNFGSLSRVFSEASSARNNRGRDPMPLTPEMLHLLDRVEPDKG